MSARNTAEDLHSDDLEIDCAPYTSGYSAKMLSHAVHEKYDSGFLSGGFDSGVDSYNSIRSHFSSIAEVREKEFDLEKGIEKIKLGSENACYDEGIQSFSDEDSHDSRYCQISPDVWELFNQDIDGDSQLHMAIINLLVPIALFIIKKAPHYEWLNLPNNMLQTPLHLAVMMRLPQVVRALMVGGADIEARDCKGDTPLHIACREGFDDIVRILMTPITSEELTMNSYRFPVPKIPQDLEARNYDGQTCLHLAAESTHLPCIKLLLVNGANINTQDGKSGRSVLHYAAEGGNTILLEFLLQFPGFNINCRTYGGLTPILLANGRGYSDIVKRLQKCGGVLENAPVEESSDSDEEMS